MKNVSRNRLLCKIYLWLFCTLCVSSCSQESLGVDKDVTVTVRLNSPGVSVEARGVSDDPKNENGSWSTAELLADGSRLYRVTLLVVDGNNKLVGIKDWNDDIKNSLPIEVSAEFRGLRSNTTYRIIAVANYSAYGNSWGGLRNFPDLANLTVGNNVSATIEALENYTLTDEDNDNVAAKQPQPLSLVKQFTTSTSSLIEVDAELLRAYARIRIVVTNRSEDMPLKVDDLKFGSSSSAFGRNNESLLPVSDGDILDAEGNLVETSEDAITGFSPLDIQPLGNENGNSEIVFDGYIYECKNADGFKYSLDLEYDLPDIPYQAYVKVGETNSITSGSYYMIGCGDNYYLSVENNQLVAVPIAASETTFRVANAIWKITQNGSNYTLQSVESTRYISLSKSNIELTTTSAQMLLSNDRKFYNNFTENRRQVKYYLYVNNGTVSVSKDNSTTLKFYSVDVENRTDSNVSEGNITIPLQTVVDGVTRPTSIIRRNDFFNILVSVRYSKLTGDLDYAVQNWTSIDGGITFQ